MEGMCIASRRPSSGEWTISVPAKGLSFGECVSTKHLYLYTTKHRTFVWPNFTSSSHSRSVAIGFSNAGSGDQRVLFEIDTNGEGDTYVVDIADCSEYPDEQESVFYPYSGFKIVDSYTDPHDSSLVVIKLSVFDTKLYFSRWMQKFEECRYAWPPGEKRVPLAQCFYDDGGTRKCAISTAFMPQFSTSACTYGSLHDIAGLVEQIKKGWDEGKRVFFLGSGAGCYSWMSLAGFGTRQAFYHTPDTDKLKSWIAGKWKEGYSVTSLLAEGDHYMTIMTRGLAEYKGSGQCWAIMDKWSDMQDFIHEKYKGGYAITSGSYSEKKKSYFFIMTKTTKGQSYKRAVKFPTEWVKERWAKKEAITTLRYDENMWLVVMTRRSGTSNRYSWGLGSN